MTSTLTLSDFEQTLRQGAEAKASAKAKHLELFAAATELAAENAGAEDGSTERAEVDAAYKAADSQNESMAQMEADFNASLVESFSSVAGEIAKLQTAASAPASFGERYVNSEEYQTKLASGNIGRQDGGELPQVSVASARETAAFLASTDGNGLIEPDRRLDIQSMVRRQIRLLDVLEIGSTDSNMVEEGVQTRRINNNDNIAHSTPGAAGVAINLVPTPESEYAWEKRQFPVRRHGHHSIQPRSMMDDAPRLEGLINDEMTYGIRLKTELQALAGDGLGENFTGIMNTAGINTRAIDNVGGETLPDAVHKSFTDARVAAEVEDINAVVMHPEVYQAFALEKDGNAAYLNGGSQHAAMPRTAWGYPVIVTTAIPNTMVLSGDFRWAKLWIRKGIEVMSGYMDQQLISDAITINMEMRAAFGVRKPEAFAAVTGIVV